MGTSRTRFRSAASLFWLARSLRTAAGLIRMGGAALDRWLDTRRAASAALNDFRTMNERELLDIGLTRVDVNRVAWGASDRCP